jgi:hypothetical protein
MLHQQLASIECVCQEAAPICMAQCACILYNPYLDTTTRSTAICAYLRLHLAARIVSGGPVRHVKSQCQDVVCLVSRIVVTQRHSSLSICSDRAPVLRSADGPLSHFLRQLLQHPHFLLLIPLGPVHDLHAHRGCLTVEQLFFICDASTLSVAEFRQ